MICTIFEGKIEAAAHKILKINYRVRQDGMEVCENQSDDSRRDRGEYFGFKNKL